MNLLPTEPLSVLFFSRGRGRGHAIPDLAIAESLAQAGHQISLTFASYSTGGDTLKKSSWPVIDLRLPEDNRLVPTLLRAHEVILEQRPDVIVSHEEFAALTAAKLVRVPAIYIGDWYPPRGSAAADALAGADSIVLIEESDTFPVPPYLRLTPRATGPVVRPMRYTLDQRDQARAELDLPVDATVISVLPGAWATEEKIPISDLVIAAFEKLNPREKRLLWINRTDAETLQARLAGRKEFRVLADCDPIERAIVASDLVVTKGNRGTTLDAASLGVPTLALASGTNPIDEVLILRIQSNITLNPTSTKPEELAARMEHLLGIPAALRQPPLGWHERGGRVAAAVLAEEIFRLCPRPQLRPVSESLNQ
jgi:UDP-N-acetylglucosamine:LPS N-acetylglucosamine transferase